MYLYVGVVSGSTRVVYDIIESVRVGVWYVGVVSGSTRVVSYRMNIFECVWI